MIAARKASGTRRAPAADAPRPSRRLPTRRRLPICNLQFAICNLQFLIVFLLLAASASASIVETIDRIQPKIVKMYGAGGFQGMKGYQTGILISPEGHILTAYSYVLDADPVTAVLADGRRFDARLLGADPRLEVAVLKIEAAGLPCFDLRKAVTAEPGTRVLALSNSFNVAVGNEQASVQKGTISVVARAGSPARRVRNPLSRPGLRARRDHEQPRRRRRRTGDQPRRTGRHVGQGIAQLAEQHLA